MSSQDDVPSGTEIDSTVEAAADAFTKLFAAEAEPTSEEEVAVPEEAPEEEAAAEDAPAEDEAPAPEPPAPVTITLKDGTALTVEEVEKGYLRQSDYTRKTQQLAEQRKAAEADYEAVRAERAVYADRMTQLEAVLSQGAPSMEGLEALRQTDPAEYAARRADILAHQQQLATVAQERQRVQQQMQQDADARHAQYLATERDRLFEAFPEWATDRDKAQQDMNALRATGADYGFSDAELDTVADHRAIRLLHDAMQYRKLVAEKQATTAKVQPKIAKAPVLTPGSTGRVVPKPTTDSRRATERLKQTGKLDDAARALAALGL